MSRDEYLGRAALGGMRQLATPRGTQTRARWLAIRLATEALPFTEKALARE
jgi:hypothetical protein